LGAKALGSRRDGGDIGGGFFYTAEAIVEEGLGNIAIGLAKEFANTALRGTIAAIGPGADFRGTRDVIGTTDHTAQNVVAHGGDLLLGIGLADELTKGVVAVAPYPHIWVIHADFATKLVVWQGDNAVAIVSDLRGF